MLFRSRVGKAKYLIDLVYAAHCFHCSHAAYIAIALIAPIALFNAPIERLFGAKYPERGGE